MGLETATYINGLVNTNPTAGDPVSQADDHVRLIKATLLATFPSLDGAVNLTDEQLNLLNNKSLASSGYQKLPSGLIIQWGSAVSAGTGSGNYVATYPIAFPTASVAASILGNGGNTTFSLVSLSATQLAATAMVASTGTITSGLGGYFIAIGY